MAKGGRRMTSERQRVREAHRPDPSGCRQLESCLRSKDSRAVWRGTGRKGSNDLARGLLYLLRRSRFRQQLRPGVRQLLKRCTDQKAVSISPSSMVVSLEEVYMHTITITLSDDRLAKLQEIAARLHIAPEELARASVEDLLARPEETCQRAIDYVLKKNAELYRRLA